MCKTLGGVLCTQSQETLLVLSEKINIFRNIQKDNSSGSHATHADLSLMANVPSGNFHRHRPFWAVVGSTTVQK